MCVTCCCKIKKPNPRRLRHMCKLNSSAMFIGRSISQTCRAVTSIVLLALLFVFVSATQRAAAQVVCVTCPAAATASGVAPGIFVTRTNGIPVNPDPSAPIGACEQIIVKTDLGYKAVAQGQTGAGYYGGTAQILAYPGPVVGGVAESTSNVTPADLATTKIGPSPCADTLDKAMNDLTYTLTAADIAAGSVSFRFNYTGGTTLISPCTLGAAGSVEFTVFISGPPSCSVAPPSTNICAGGSASFTATGSGPATGQAGGVAGGGWTFRWSGPNGFTQTNSGVLNSTITINNAQPVNAEIG